MIPYVGVTGITNQREVIRILNGMPRNSKRKLMVGVLASSKTISGIPNRWPNRYPTRENLGQIFLPHRRVLNLIHFNTDEPELLYEQMMQARNLAGNGLCHGFQINVAWPDPRTFGVFALLGQRTFLVLQIGARAFEMVGHSPEKLAEKVASEYKGVLLDYILLDPSGGQGKQLDAEVLRPYLRALKAKQLKWTSLGVAGGLSASTLHLVAPLVEEFPDLSIDAEAGLRDSNDNLDVNAAIAYVNDAIALFEGK